MLGLASFRSVSVLALLSGLVACAPTTTRPSANAGDSPCSESAPAAAQDRCGLVCRAEVPLATPRAVPLATVWLNGQPARMVVDTGAGISALTPPAVRRLGLTGAVPLPVPVFGFGGLQHASSVTVSHAAFGQVALRNVSFAVLITPTQSLDAEPDGVLGVDLLSRYDIDMDVPHGRMRLYAGRPCPGGLPGWTSDDAAIAFTPAFKVGRQIAIPVTIQGEATLAVLDSGAQETIIGAMLASRIGVPKQELASDLAFVGSGAGPRRTLALQQRFTNVQVGRQTLPELETAILPLSRDYPQMFLGADYFGTHKVWISYATNQVHLAHSW